MASVDLTAEVDRVIEFIESFEVVGTPSRVAKATSQSTDCAFQPVIPPGHTSFSWNVNEPVQTPEPKTSVPKRPPAQVSTEKKAKPQSKPKQTKAKQASPKKQQQKAASSPKKGSPKDKKAKPKRKEIVVKGHDRRDNLVNCQNKIQSMWSKKKVFESNPIPNKPKFMCTFPYPYMNGFLHLGHGFTLSKAEFAAGYQRMKGHNTLFPFGFHCTGMPIAAAAKKITDEMEAFGNPPKFPKEEATAAKPAPKKKKGKKKKGKQEKKKSTKKYQWQIMKECGLTDKDIPAFTDPYKWLNHFPGIGMDHLKKFGLKVDWRRSFITTDVNPFYDAYIRWQFNKLHAEKYLYFGNRPSVFSTVKMQPCGDHDRAEGEQKKPQNYTLIKMRVLEGETPYTKEKGDQLAEFFKLGKPIYMVAGTLRPETMYGQTNCFILPNGKYVLVETKDGELWITGKLGADNMTWQNLLKGEQGKYEVVGNIIGRDLLGRKVKAPYCKYEYVHVLPLETIKMDKATGVVTSVPSDAPDDYIALKDLKKDKGLRKKCYITEEMVKPFEVVSICHIPATDEHPELGDTSAPALCEARKVKNQFDTEKLEEIKEICYQNGFSKGKMTVGKYAGEYVKFAKDKVKKDMIDAGLAAEYWEPEDTVIARTGDRCVVAFTDQWYIRYGSLVEWKETVKKHIDTMEFYNPKTRKKFEEIIEWLDEWACSREFGLGTKLPCDKQFVVESLSDSTIYMAYYTIAHILQGDCDFVGKKSDIEPSWLTDEVFDYIFQKGPMPKTKIPKEKMEAMRAEFEYWYPLDLRVSGKDLIGNHLTMALYNHAAIWKGEPSKWPQAYYTNGHLQINGAKMSKSTGNFKSLIQACEEFGTDATRFALADAGDSNLDSNFEIPVANAAILGLTKEEVWMTEQMIDNRSFNRTGDYTELDRMFDNAMSVCIQKADEAYAGMKFKQALGSSWHALQRHRDFWRHNCESWHQDIIDRFVRTQILLLTPICPHWCEHMWEKLGFAKKERCLVVDAEFPKPKELDYGNLMKYDFIQGFRKAFSAEFNRSENNNKKMYQRAKKKKPDTVEPPKSNACRIFVAGEYFDYQLFALEVLKKHYDQESNEVSNAYRSVLKKCQYNTKQVMDFATMIVREDIQQRGVEALDSETPYDEMKTIKENLKLICGAVHEVPLENIEIYQVTDTSMTEKKDLMCKSRAIPRKPTIYFFHK